MSRVVVDGGDSGSDDDSGLVLDRAEPRERVLGLCLVVQRLLDHEVRVDRVPGHRRFVVGGTDRREAQPRSHALLIVEGQFVDPGGDDVAVRRHVADVQGLRGRNRFFLRGQLLLSLDLIELTLVLSGRLVWILERPVAVPLGVLLLELA